MAAAAPRGGAAMSASRRSFLLVGGAMLATACAAPALRPVRAQDETGRPDYEHIVPGRFGEWSLDSGIVAIPPAPDVQANLDKIYDQVVSRTYVNGRRERMMLTVAYGGDQSDALKAHRQEACYAAQGFQIRNLSHGELRLSGRSVPVTRLHAVRGARSEPVTYWLTMGDRVVLGRLERLFVQLRFGLSGRIPDGVLVRVSSISAQPRQAFQAHEEFIAALLGSLPAGEIPLLFGGIRA
jgi:EpsI family protein